MTPIVEEVQQGCLVLSNKQEKDGYSLQEVRAITLKKMFSALPLCDEGGPAKLWCVMIESSQWLIVI